LSGDRSAVSTGHDVKAESAGLRSSGLETYGSGGGGIPHTAIIDTFPQLWALAAIGKVRIDTERVPLADVERARHGKTSLAVGL
jgi:hypothetical protein